MNLLPKKYRVGNLCKNNLYQITAVKSFGTVKRGDKGGYISGEHNLSHSGNCWIDKDSAVYERAAILGDAIVKESVVRGRAIIRDEACVKDCCLIEGDTVIGGSYTFSNVYLND